ncbi:DUF3048 domain-containing protein [Candidatus Uhrbacteria bacterium]|nr:DUF3048 domain-containing protein [Candidatus Uhrbacteria bacterium]
MLESQKKEQIRMKKTDQPLLVGLLVILGLVVLVAAVFPRFIYRSQEQQTLSQELYEEVLYRHPLTGMALNEAMDLPQVFAVMIDNHSDAWPPAGIDQAFLVIEAPVEAGMSRMEAFFTQEVEIEKIGPVRSARPYFLDWANEFDAQYVHVGGSNEALDLIASGDTFDMNQYWWGQYFWRSTNRYAPHNVYTSSDYLNEFYTVRAEAGVVPTRLYDLWEFKNPSPSGSEGLGLHIDFLPPVYVVDWVYNTETNQYERSQYLDPHLVESGAQLTADNVALVLTDVSVIDAVGRRAIRTTGEGEGYVFQDGNVIEATWRKPSKSERLKFYDRETGEEIIMNAGKTWIEIVGDEEDVIIK